MEQQPPDRKVISTNTRYPKEVYASMKRLAAFHGRSFNSEVIWALREYISRQKDVEHDGQSHHHHQAGAQPPG